MQEQLFYKTFSFSFYTSSFSIAPAARGRCWAALASRLRIAHIRRHYSAWIIQSAWRQSAGKRNPPDLTQYFRLPLAAFQEAEWRAIAAFADQMTSDALDAAIGHAAAGEEEDN
jgi:hypothetical protein